MRKSQTVSRVYRVWRVLHVRLVPRVSPPRSRRPPRVRGDARRCLFRLQNSNQTKSRPTARGGEQPRLCDGSATVWRQLGDSSTSSQRRFIGGALAGTDSFGPAPSAFNFKLGALCQHGRIHALSEPAVCAGLMRNSRSTALARCRHHAVASCRVHLLSAGAAPVRETHPAPARGDTPPRAYTTSVAYPGPSQPTRYRQHAYSRVHVVATTPHPSQCARRTHASPTPVVAIPTRAILCRNLSERYPLTTPHDHLTTPAAASTALPESLPQATSPHGPRPTNLHALAQRVAWYFPVSEATHLPSSTTRTPHAADTSHLSVSYSRLIATARLSFCDFRTFRRGSIPTAHPRSQTSVAEET